MSKSYKFKKFEKSESKEDILPHKHCPVCGKQIYDLQLNYCSNICKEIAEKKEKKEKKKLWKTIGIMIGVFVIFICIFIILSNFF